jgi:hypothetical protein
MEGPFRVKYSVSENNARLESLFIGAEERVLINIDHPKIARERREIFAKTLAFNPASVNACAGVINQSGNGAAKCSAK